jgi:ABC-type multidrug transport system fused ATPase/permease subunit
LAIARAIYKDAEVLFFDEATSELDLETEQMVTDSIYALSGRGITMFIIAHRIQTLKHCDKIFELKKGKISAPKTYAEVC